MRKQTHIIILVLCMFLAFPIWVSSQTVTSPVQTQVTTTQPIKVFMSTQTSPPTQFQLPPSRLAPPALPANALLVALNQVRQSMGMSTTQSLPASIMLTPRTPRIDTNSIWVTGIFQSFDITNIVPNGFAVCRNSNNNIGSLSGCISIILDTLPEKTYLLNLAVASVNNPDLKWTIVGSANGELQEQQGHLIISFTTTGYRAFVHIWPKNIGADGYFYSAEVLKVN
jgi:hypothetical protein